MKQTKNSFETPKIIPYGDTGSDPDDMESEHASGVAAHVLDAVRAKRAVVLSKPKRHDQLAAFEALDRAGVLATAHARSHCGVGARAIAGRGCVGCDGCSASRARATLAPAPHDR